MKESLRKFCGTAKDKIIKYYIYFASLIFIVGVLLSPHIKSLLFYGINKFHSTLYFKSFIIFAITFIILFLLIRFFQFFRTGKGLAIAFIAYIILAPIALFIVYPMHYTSDVYATQLVYTSEDSTFWNRDRIFEFVIALMNGLPPLVATLIQFFSTRSHAKTGNKEITREMYKEYKPTSPTEIIEPKNKSSKEQKRSSASDVDKDKKEEASVIDEPIARERQEEDAEAQFRLGCIYEDGEGVSQNYEKAMEYYSKAADQGDADAYCNIGLMHEDGLGVPQSYEKAIEWYSKAAEKGHARGQANLGAMHEKGLGVPQNYEKAAEWYQKSADQGNAKAQASIGFMYIHGFGFPQSYEKALELSQKAADKGNARAQNNLGAMYQNGIGIEKKFKKAVEFYQKSADKGNAKAQGNLGCMYANGWGVTQDDNKAVELFIKSAKQGESKGQVYLGQMYYEGRGGLVKNFNKAYAWLSIAAANDNRYAKELLETLEKEISQEAIEKGQNLAEQFLKGNYENL